MTKFKVGQLVILKSGGPAMVVARVPFLGRKIFVEWYQSPGSGAIGPYSGLCDGWIYASSLRAF
jgi:uncharacterized protein YodC (DUF2158 family)